MLTFSQWLLEQEDPITQEDLKNIELYADKLGKRFGIDVEFTKHFIERINDKRNGKQITFSEMIDLFRKAFKRYGRDIENMEPGDEAVLNDLASELNLPFVLKWDSKNKELDMVNKTILRKKNFYTPDKKLQVK